MPFITPSANGLYYVDKDPAALLDYSMDWSKWLAGDTIVSTVWSAEAGLSVNHSSADSDTVTVWLSGGASGRTYVVTCTVTTAGGRIDLRSLRVKVRNR